MPISELLLTELDAEIKTTRETLSRIPGADKADFRPHPKSMPLGKLAPHVAQLAEFGITILTTPELDFSKSSMRPLPFESAEQLVKAFDAGAGKTAQDAREYSGRRVERQLETQLSRASDF